MPDASTMVALFDRWELVWHERRFDLVPDCHGEIYLRHAADGDRAVSRDAYAAELARLQSDRPGIRVVVYDHLFEGNRAWFRFAFKWRDPETGEPASQAGLQTYRTEGGRLVETWISMMPVGSAWTDTAAQQRWTSPPPGG